MKSGYLISQCNTSRSISNAIRLIKSFFETQTRYFNNENLKDGDLIEIKNLNKYINNYEDNNYLVFNYNSLKQKTLNEKIIYHWNFSNFINKNNMSNVQVLKSFPSISIVDKFIPTKRNYKVLGRVIENRSDEEGLEENDNLTPAMKQYWKFKKQLDSNCILLFRIGDFYEMYYEDAEIASKLLGIQLTKRSNSTTPMAGVPSHAIETHVSRLLRHNVKVAICDQVEKASERQSKKVLERDIVRIVTPGTVIEDQLLEGNQNSYLLAISYSHDDNLFDKLGLSWYDLSTGMFHVSETTYQDLQSNLVRISPREIILPDELREIDEINNSVNDFFITIPNSKDSDFFDKESTIKRMQDLFVDHKVENIFTELELMAAGAIIGYIQSTQREFKPRFNFPTRHGTNTHLTIDAATFKSLEIMRSLSTNTKKGSLLGSIDLTITSHGGRELCYRLGAPLVSKELIEERLNCVEFFKNNLSITESIRRILKNTSDVERILQQISIGKGRPHHLVSISTTIEQCKSIVSALDQFSAKKFSSHIAIPLSKKMLSFSETVNSAIDLKLFDGFLRKGFNEEVDEARKLKNDTKSIIDNLQKKYREETGISSLKIKEANHMGYTIQIAGSSKRLQNDKFRLIRSFKSGSRYTTDELTELVYKIEHASETISSVEEEILLKFIQEVLSIYDELISLSSSIANIDVLSSLGLLANQRQYTRPEILEDLSFEIKDGRHVVVENSIQLSGVSFKSNDCKLSENANPIIWLITGPNMGGKSTFLRQNAIILILAQIGSFVPADSARIGIADKLFSRVGAQDNLFNDQSTFMVEMQETAHILNNATQRSLVIMDEVGRGTSVTDGLAIAQSVLEYLHNNIGCRGLFATHYRELSKTNSELNRLRLHSSKVEEINGKIIFTYKIEPGITSQSYGVHVARMANVPKFVCDRAEIILKELDKNKIENL